MYLVFPVDIFTVYLEWHMGSNRFKPTKERFDHLRFFLEQFFDSVVASNHEDTVVKVNHTAFSFTGTCVSIGPKLQVVAKAVGIEVL